MSLLKSTFIIGSFTLISRIFGFLRDILIANTIGASFLSDAFFVAFKLPNFFRRLFAEGAFNAAFVPQFSRFLEGDGREAARKFASEALSVLLLALLVLNVIFLCFMPFILQFFAPGFVGDAEKYNLTVTLSRITFPYILFISLVSLLGGILNSISRFAAVAATPILLNFCLIGSLLFLSEHFDTPAHALAVGVFIAGIVQLAWLCYVCFKQHMLPSLLPPKLTPQVRKLLKLIAPAALGAGVAQINLLVDVILASKFDEGVSYLYYADWLNELPIGIIGVAVGTALLPLLSRQIKAGNQDAAIHSLNRAMEIVLLFGIPSAMAFLIIPQPIIQVLYQHGEFSAADTQATYAALIAYAAGLPAFVLVKVLAPCFFANEDTKSPFIISTICVGVNVVFNLILMQYYAHVGLAMATTIAAWVNVALMAIILHKRRLLCLDNTAKHRLPRIVLSSLCMAAGLWGLQQQLEGWFIGTLSSQIAGLTLLIATGMLLYAIAILALKTISMKDMKLYFSRQKQ